MGNIFDAPSYQATTPSQQVDTQRELHNAPKKPSSDVPEVTLLSKDAARKNTLCDPPGLSQERRDRDPDQ